MTDITLLDLTATPLGYRSALYATIDLTPRWALCCCCCW